ncbi:MAG: hypothetical protein ACKVUS_19550, partial [Saprospiraceae bacterium]
IQANLLVSPSKKTTQNGQENPRPECRAIVRVGYSSGGHFIRGNVASVAVGERRSILAAKSPGISTCCGVL